MERPASEVKDERDTAPILTNGHQETQDYNTLSGHHGTNILRQVGSFKSVG